MGPEQELPDVVHRRTFTHALACYFKVAEWTPLAILDQVDKINLVNNYGQARCAGNTETRERDCFGEEVRVTEVAEPITTDFGHIRVAELAITD